MIRRTIRSSILCGTAPDAAERIFPKQVLFQEAPAFLLPPSGKRSVVPHESARQDRVPKKERFCVKEIFT